MSKSSKLLSQKNSPEISNSKYYRVLVAGMNSINRKMHKTQIELHGHIVSEAVNGFDALSLITDVDFDIVVLEPDLSGISWETLCEHIHNRLDLPHLPILLVTNNHIGMDVINNLKSGVFDFIRNPHDTEELIIRIELAAQKKRKADQFDNVESVLFALARMVEAKDENTGDHCSRLQHTANVFGQALGLEENELIALRRGAILHDIGKLGIPDNILLKDGSLTEEEWVIMRQHPKIGEQLCSGLKSMRLTLPIIAHHHERWDGSGYPLGLKGKQIPFLARVFQCLDIYDALSNERPYKKAFSNNEVINIMHQEMTKGWRDPELVDKFIDILRKRPDDLVLPENEVMDGGALIYKDVLASGVLDQC